MKKMRQMKYAHCRSCGKLIVVKIRTMLPLCANPVCYIVNERVRYADLGVRNCQVCGNLFIPVHRTTTCRAPECRLAEHNSAGQLSFIGHMADTLAADHSLPSVLGSIIGEYAYEPMTTISGQYHGQMNLIWPDMYIPRPRSGKDANIVRGRRNRTERHDRPLIEK
jgi:hypothetical protein